MTKSKKVEVTSTGKVGRPRLQKNAKGPNKILIGAGVVALIALIVMAIWNPFNNPLIDKTFSATIIKPADKTRPTCSLDLTQIYLKVGQTKTYYLTCTDNVGIQKKSLNRFNFDYPATKIGVNLNSDSNTISGKTSTALIFITADKAGKYTLYLKSGIIKDTSGNILNKKALATVQVYAK